jgi:(2Fe-2S) ferredoxin
LPGTDAPERGGAAVVLLAKSAIAAAPRREMEAMAAIAAARAGVAHATHAFSEQGQPSLRDVLLGLRREGYAEIRIVPLLLPMEPSFAAWIAKTVLRWQALDDEPWPSIRVGTGPDASAVTAGLVADLVEAAAHAPTLARPEWPAVTGSVVAAAGRRIVVCQGGPCNEAGAAVLWGHLRNEQERLGLRTAGRGTMSAKSSCLGPCSLAPVVEVWPEGTVYGGVDEAGLDRIVAEHLIGDRPVADLAYDRTGKKQFLREVV